MAGLIIGIILIGIGVFLFFNRKKNLNKALDIKYYQNTTIASLKDIYEGIKEQLGIGSYNEIVEMSGVAITDNPLEAEHSQKPVVYCSAQVVREYEVQVERRDSNGNTSWSTERRSETVSNNTSYVPFYLKDSTGEILVDMEGAEAIAQQTFDRFEQNAPAGYSFSSDSNTIGYRYKEKSIPLNAKLYVLGEASDRKNGEIAIVKPTDPKKQFIVSTKSEEELLKGIESNAQWSFYGSIALAAAGGISMILGIVNLVR